MLSHSALALSSLGLLLVLGTWVVYMRSVLRVRVAVSPVNSAITQVLGLTAAVAAIAVLFARGGSSWALLPAGLAIVMAALFLWLLTQRKTPVGNIRVAVGDRLLPFSATTSAGTQFRSADIAGDRVLLKFFRGGW